jgi:hypothetical protein
MKRGRKSHNQLLIEDLSLGVRYRRPPQPPPELTDAQAQVWRDAVASMPATWLTRGARHLLVEYTRHVCRARLLEAQIAAFETEWAKAPGGLERLDRLLAMAERETKSLTACARALRLTPRSLQDPKEAYRRVAELPPEFPPPWR